MGSCPSTCRQLDDFLLLQIPAADFRDYGRNPQLEKVIVHMFNNQKRLELYHRHDAILRIWDIYLKHSTSDYNIMTTAADSESFYPIMTTASSNKSFCLVSEESNRQTMRSQSWTPPMCIAHHSRLVHNFLTSCLNEITNKEIIDHAITLYCLGRYHAHKNVQEKDIKNFARSATKIILDINSKKTSSESDKKFQQHPYDERYFNEFFTFISESMVMGLRKHEWSVKYVNMLSEKQGNCFTRGRVEKKCVELRSRENWRRLARQILLK